MALDKRYMDTMVGVEKTALAEMTRAAFAVSAYNNAAVIAFNEKHGANSPINIIHDELAFRLYPFLKNAYVKTADLESTARSYTEIERVGRLGRYLDGRPRRERQIGKNPQKR